MIGMDSIHPRPGAIRSKMFFDDAKKTAQQKEKEFLGQFKGEVHTRKNAIAITYKE